MRKLTLPRLLVYMVVVAIPFWFSSCYKDDSEVIAPPSIEGNWKLAAVTSNPSELEGSSNFGLQLRYGERCLNDKIFTFNKDGSLKHNNPKSCDDLNGVSAEAGIGTANKWLLANNKLVLSDSVGIIGTYDNVKISLYTLQWSNISNVTAVNGKPMSSTLTALFRRAR